MNAIEIENFNVWLSDVVDDPSKHARWLNTLSYLENCGARKIASCQHPTKVKREMLKHAAEEFRHAYHLKRQIAKTGVTTLEDYSNESILGGRTALRYLDKLDAAICRYLKSDFGLSGESIRERAYLLVTYAIEVRASLLYPLYQEILTAKKQSISMRAIILEEENHLSDISEELQKYPGNEVMKLKATAIENNQFYHLINSLI